MVRAEHVSADERAFEPRAQGSGNEEVINAPTNVPLPHARHRAPPGVMTAARLEFAKGVKEAGLNEGAETGPLFGREPMVADVGFGIGEVELRMSDIQVAAENDRLGSLQLFQVTAEIAVPLLSVSQAGEFALRVGHINVDQEEIRVLGGEHAALAVVTDFADAAGDVQAAGQSCSTSSGPALVSCRQIMSGFSSAR